MSNPDHEKILQFVAQTYAGGSGIDIETELVRSEIIDSYGIVQMIQFIEDSYSISFPDEDITPDNFRSVKAIADCVARITSA